jgi:hypothetical protein
MFVTTINPTVEWKLNVSKANSRDTGEYGIEIEYRLLFFNDTESANKKKTNWFTLDMIYVTLF